MAIFDPTDDERAKAVMLVALSGSAATVPCTNETVFSLPAAGESTGSYVHPEDAYLFDQMISAVAEDRARKPVVQLRWLCGQDRWTRVLAEFEACEGPTIKLTIIKDEIASARHAEAQMRHVVEGSAQGIVVRTPAKVLYMNKSFAKMLGYPSQQECIDNEEHINSIIHPDDVPKVLGHMKARLSGRETVSHYEFRLVRRDRSILWVETYAAGVNWNGQAASLSWIIDVSDRKVMECELVRSKEEAEHANRSKTEFLANMSHELRTPLNAILGFSEMISSRMLGPINSRYAEYAEDIHRSGNHLLDLINDVLDLSKLEAGKLELHESAVSLDVLIEDAARIVRDRAKSMGVTLQVEHAIGLPLIRADERSVRQILLNLMSNAIKFTPEGGTVTVKSDRDPGGQMNVSVSDTGIGMSAADIEVALSPFGQVDSKQARKSEGTGLGLPICQSLMRLHGGELVISSAPGRGTAITARFPHDRAVPSPDVSATR